MSLNYVDKGSDTRANPSPNAPDIHQNPLAHGTTSIAPRSEGTQAKAKVITKDSRIIAFDGSNNIGLFGFDDTGNMVIKVAKTGFDANTASNSNLIFNSQQDTFKVVSTGTSSVSLPAGSYTAIQTWSNTIAHGLSATPALMGFVDMSGLPSLALTTGLSPVPGLGYISTTLGTNVYMPVYIADISVDSTNVYCRVSWTYGSLTLASNYTVNFKYYLLQETAS